MYSITVYRSLSNVELNLLFLFTWEGQKMPRVHLKMINICSVLLQVNMIGMHVVHILFYVPIWKFMSQNHETWYMSMLKGSGFEKKYKPWLICNGARMLIILQCVHFKKLNELRKCTHLTLVLNIPVLGANKLPCIKSKTHVWSKWTKNDVSYKAEKMKMLFYKNNDQFCQKSSIN